jgi:hypothetical protein
MLYHRRGTKSFTGTVEGDVVTFRCSCDIFTSISVVVKMPLALAQALIARRPAQEVLAGFPRAAVELFTSGMTEAEFDFTYGRSTKSLEHYELYAANPGAGSSEENAAPAETPRPADSAAGPQEQLAFLH